MLRRSACALLTGLVLVAAPVRAQALAASAATPAAAPRSVVLRAAGPAAAPAPPVARHDRWIAYDKAQHVLASALLVLATQYVLEDKGGASARSALPLSVGTSLSAGFAKESWDARRVGGTGFSKKDLVADAAGIAAAVAVILW